ncbi:MAG: PD-(D/E)XK nuclease family protein [Deltaproteobacteria bacterium]|jgi:RecB family exonuclease|nr:PD-(D/E)XK nuclease family protein [Deltaproteobacteria bacterium]
MPEHDNKKLFQVISWQEDFLPALVKLALQDGQFEQALFIFPHARPARYLKKIILLEPEIKKPCLLPEILPVHEAFQKLHNEILGSAVNISRLDQIGLIRECARAEQMKLPVEDTRYFFPWGARLADLFEDCFIHGVKPVNFLYLEDELAPYAASLLARLADLHKRYLEALAERNWTTSGLSAFRVAEKIRDKSVDNGFEHILSQKFIRGRRIYIAGFYNPNGSENILFHKLWSAYAATVVVHADAKLVNFKQTGKAHWSCAGIEQWRQSWKSGFNLTGESANAPTRQITYYAGYDLHSQLLALNSALDAARMSAPQDSSAVILPDTRLLLPVLHHMRDKDLNISMGYPLEHTPLNHLLENILALQEHKPRQKPQGSREEYYWKDCLRLIRHPYVKMLAVNPETPEKESDKALLRELWRNYLHELDKKLRSGRRFTDLGALMQESASCMDGHIYAEALRQFAGKLAEIFLKSWENVRTLADLAKALARLCSLMTGQGEELWRRFPIDAECLYRFMRSIIPELDFSALRDEELPPEVLFAILRRLIQEERVAFEADPLTATQVIGLLESRLLSFKRVFILEATDDLLPGGSQNDPLLPDSLRQELGLPNLFRKQQMTAYYFYRLLAGAEQIHLFWEENPEQKGLQDAKKLKSRFVEELLWQEEQKLGRILKPVHRAENPKSTAEASACFPSVSDGPLHLLTSDAGAFSPQDRVITINGAIRDAVNATLKNDGKGLSAGKLNCFLTCPLSFYYQEIARLRPVNAVMEDDDPIETGDLLHKVFQAYYSPKLGCILNKREQSHTELIHCFRQVMRQSSIPDTFPQDALVWLRQKAPFQLRKYLDEQPEQTRVIALEAEAEAGITVDGYAQFKLAGRLDRIDERVVATNEVIFTDGLNAGQRESGEEDKLAGLIVLDYKTGKISPPQADFWSDAGLWKNIREALAQPGQSRPELLSDIADGLNGNIQLPLYLFLLRHGRLKGQQDTGGNIARSGNIYNAAWVELRDSGKEHPLLPETLSQNERTEILDRNIPDLLAFILSGIKNSRTFEARRNGHCAYCPYADLCRTG